MHITTSGATRLHKCLQEHYLRGPPDHPTLLKAEGEEQGSAEKLDTNSSPNNVGDCEDVTDMGVGKEGGGGGGGPKGGGVALGLFGKRSRSELEKQNQSEREDKAFIQQTRA